LLRHSVTNFQIEILAKLVLVGITSLQPAVDELMNVVKIILASAARSVRCTRSIGVGHATAPAIILSDGREYVTVVGGQEINEKPSPRPDIEIYLLAVAIWSTYTLFPGDLHEALLTGSTDG